MKEGFSVFNNVIVRRPCRAMVEGITSNPQLGKPDYEKALLQHDSYIAALKECGVAVTVLPADERYPDSCFVEDPADASNGVFKLNSKQHVYLNIINGNNLLKVGDIYTLSGYVKGAVSTTTRPVTHTLVVAVNNASTNAAGSPLLVANGRHNNKVPASITPKNPSNIICVGEKLHERLLF